MAVYRKSSRGLWLPGGQPTIDWTNPITAGLVGCWVVTGEGGPNSGIRDIVTQNIVPQSGSPTIVSGAEGIQARDAANSGWSQLCLSSQKPTSAFSMLWFGRIFATSVLGAQPPLWAVKFDNAGGSPFYSWGMFRSATTTIVNLAWNSGGSLRTLAATVLNPAGGANGAGLFSLLGTVALGGNSYFWSKGIQITTAAAPSGSITYSGTATLYNFQGTSFPGAGMYAGALWNRQLTPGESALISADPTNFLLFPGDQLQRLNPGKIGAALAAALAAAAATSAALMTAIQMQAAPAAASVVTAAMSTSIRMAAALASASTVAADLTTGIVLAATSASVAAATAALTTAITLATGLAAAISSATSSLTTAIRLAAAMAAQALGVADLTVSVIPHAISPHLSVRRRMIARKGRDIILRHGGQTFTDTSFRAFVHAFQPREITEGLKQGDQRVETLSDVTPIVGDKLLIGGKVFNVLGAGVIYDGDTLLGYSLLVRG